jgi:hypothetical protein
MSASPNFLEMLYPGPLLLRPLFGRLELRLGAHEDDGGAVFEPSAWTDRAR